MYAQLMTPAEWARAYMPNKKFGLTTSRKRTVGVLSFYIIGGLLSWTLNPTMAEVFGQPGRGQTCPSPSISHSTRSPKLQLV